MRALLLAVGEDPDRAGLAGTPERLARAYREMFAGLHEDPAEALDAPMERLRQALRQEGWGDFVPEGMHSLR